MALTTETQQQVFDLLSRSSNLSFIAADALEPALPDASQQLLTLAPGQKVNAEVIGQPVSGKIPVQIAGQQLQLDLQMTVRLGQNIELTFVGNDPRPTFAMARPGITAPPVSLSDASRLLSLLVSNDQFMDPNQRSSLQSIGNLLRQSTGEASVLAGFLDDFLTYRTDGRATVVPPGGLPEQPQRPVGDEPDQPPSMSTGSAMKPATPFEENASKMLLNLAQRAKLTLVDVANHPMAPLPLEPGDEATALVQGRLPGGRVLVQLAGESLELLLSKPVVQGEIMRLALVTQQPKLVFALLGQPLHDQPSNVSDAARWLSSLVNEESGKNDLQRAVMTRLQQIVSSLPAGSSALAAIMDEAMIYNASSGALSHFQHKPTQASLDGRLDEGVLKLLQSLMQGNRMALIEPQIPQQSLKGFQPGKQLRGDVIQSLGNGRFLVEVAGQTFEVPLPKGIKPGEGLNLFFISDEPPAFLLVRHEKGGDAAVSRTGRWISNLLGMQEQTAPPKEGLGIMRTVADGPPSDPARLEQLLKQGLKESGLFYESHLARWFSGEYPLKSLLQEPQGSLSVLSGGQASSEQLQLEEGSDPRTLTILKEQLATLQSGQLLFQGELFPGQFMEWRIREREGHGGRDEKDQEHPWETSLTLNLANLGRVEASFKLQDTRLDLVISAEKENTVRLMDEDITELHDQLSASGITPGNTIIRHGS